MRSPGNLAVWWIVANAVGWAGTMGVFEALPNPLKPAACVIIGTAQWLALRSQLRMSPWWIMWTSLAWFGGLWAGVIFSFFGVPDALWAGGIGGALAGILQCWILGRRVSRPMLWLPVSVVASVAGWWAGYYVGMSFSRLTDSWLYVLAGAAGGVVIGTLSAPGLVWMARHPKAPSEGKTHESTPQG